MNKIDIKYLVACEKNDLNIIKEITFEDLSPKILQEGFEYLCMGDTSLTIKYILENVSHLLDRESAIRVATKAGKVHNVTEIMKDAFRYNNNW